MCAAVWMDGTVHTEDEEEDCSVAAVQDDSCRRRRRAPSSVLLDLLVNLPSGFCIVCPVGSHTHPKSKAHTVSRIKYARETITRCWGLD
eukprot:scaffold61142_cov57-Cyclotella_meneghiniana.AAC.15